MANLPNGNATFMELYVEPIRIVVIGEPGCGKTTFIRAFYDIALHIPTIIVNNIRILGCKYEFDGVMRTIELIEVHSDFNNQIFDRPNLYRQSDIYIFMFDSSEVVSFHNLRDKWLAEAKPILLEKCDRIVVFVANKMDIGNIPEISFPFSEVMEDIEDYDWYVNVLTLTSLNVVEVLNVFRSIIRMKFPPSIEDDSDDD